MLIEVFPNWTVMRSSRTVNLPSRIPAKKTSHFPINEPHDIVIINYTIGLGKVVVHEAHVWVGFGVREENITF